jgi:aspartate/methionine/tyrosine aminotransferase
METGWKIDPAKLEELIDSETKMIILNNPNNPTSKAMDSKTLDAVVEVANRKGITVLSDEVYGAIAFNKTKSILDYGADSKHILSNGFSKTFTMTGWRVGYIVRQQSLHRPSSQTQPNHLQQRTRIHPRRSPKGLELHAQIASNIKAKYKARADLATSKLSAAGFKFTTPDAPFYVFPKRDGLDGTKFTLDLLDKGVAVAPAQASATTLSTSVSANAPDDQIEVAWTKSVRLLNENSVLGAERWVSGLQNTAKPKVTPSFLQPGTQSNLQS